MANRILSYKKVDEYFELLAQKHVEINDYIGTSQTELSSKLTSFDGVASPFFVFFNYQGKLTGNQQRTFNTRTLSFSICYIVKDLEDFVAQKEAIDNAEIIGLEVLSRINYDSKLQNIGWLYNNFEKDSVNYNEIELEKPDGIFGMEFHFDLKNIEPLTATPEKWTDGELICT